VQPAKIFGNRLPLAAVNTIVRQVLPTGNLVSDHHERGEILWLL